MYFAQLAFSFVLSSVSFFILHICGAVGNNANSFDQSWGLPDAVAYSRLAFVYQLPKSADSYELTESGLDFLPNWLEYDSVNKELLGVARQDDVGKQFFIEVKSSTSNTVDIFKIEVEDNKKLQLLNENNNVKNYDNNPDSNIDVRHHHQHIIYCKKNKHVTTALIILKVGNKEFYDITPQSKVNMLKRFSNSYNFPLPSLQLFDLKECDEMNHFNKTALVAGPGDSNPNFKLGSKHQHLEIPDNEHSIVIKWLVGCGNVQKRHLVVLQQVEIEAQDGRLKDLLGLGVVGWYLATATPTLEIHPPVVTKPTPTVVYPSTTASTTKKPSKLASHSKGPKGKKTTTALPRVYVGQFYKFTITPDFFSGPYKTLELLSQNGLTLPDSSWIKLNSTRPRSKSYPYIYGIPMSQHEGLQDYLLKAVNKLGNETGLYLKFQVVKIPEQYITYEMNVLLPGYDYTKFCQDVDIRLELAKKISLGFGDLDPSDVLMTKADEGSVDYFWTNKTMTLLKSAGQNDRRLCHDSELLFDKFISKSTRKLSEVFIKQLHPDRISFAEVISRGECERYVSSRQAFHIQGIRVTQKTKKQPSSIAVTPRSKTFGDVDDTFKYSVSNNNIPEVKFDETSSRGDEEKVVASKTDDELIKQIVIPTLIVAVLVLLALLIACVAYRRKTKQCEKQKSIDTTELVKKGAPVIFAHELDDHPPTTPSTRPLITSAEKSPRPPNYHQRIMSSGPGATSSSGYSGF
ncbi:hypothetical protein HELRODRAFT_188507 [Helobdella robusta]|uniref:Peptidase S72 domain-containing protein n=1 Tax=Helobdella robusta TaxID=6412 RepID=T1FQ26_HELRO|nr:hypothetical protein HELRODRAFT_188507 [Helobdella robusta]ESO01869.1 hypothetical protein HELRODRAFT_188507 [Helobdella robusta]